MATEFWKRSYVTGKTYDYFSNNIVRILNLKQAMAFISNGAELIDIYTTKDRKSGESVLLFVFDKDSTKDLYELWLRHELDIKDNDL